jgi:hypothetical protein
MCDFNELSDSSILNFRRIKISLLMMQTKDTNGHLLVFN